MPNQGEDGLPFDAATEPGAAHESGVGIPAKERPILFSAPMVLAILEGRKTQTRRVMKPQPRPEFLARGLVAVTPQWPLQDGVRWFMADGMSELVPCPYGAPGDRLWVRERLTVCSEGIEYAADSELGFDLTAGDERAIELWNHYANEAGPDLHPTSIPSIHMPRWASRITLELTGVRVERVLEIMPLDAIAEGIQRQAIPDLNGNHFHWGDAGHDREPTELHAYAMLWDSINGKKSGAAWADNPWVWVLEFAVIRRLPLPNTAKPPKEEPLV